ncbi:hypothetical protein LPB19_14390 [Marinobacter salinisoli]|uniref:Uncharacterized protein n=1 Tax=Marinobacter salinisoli TaxID=2769486 RepID=A0ABX7MSE2_9GAMM|nr:hypothetical protein [Marinobacter salinisoli]QSP94355.1 hypothetical protein LPB19_14390 [Marinobacter salinisoli]
MADQQKITQPTIDLASGAVLRPGRAADPLPATLSPDAASGQVASEANAPSNGPDNTARNAVQPELAVVGEHESGASEGALSEEEPDADPSAKADADPDLAKALASQRELRMILRQCDRVLLMDFEQLAMSHWPDNYALAAARRYRDLWLFAMVIAGLLFLSGLSGFVAAWIAGAGFGAMMVLLMLGVPSLRRLISARPSYVELLTTRRRMLREARAHAAHLEGAAGLVWQCARMARFNPALANARFSPLVRASERRRLPHYLSRREHVRLYLMYMLEAEKAYSRVQKAFFKGNQNAIDRGWQEVAAEPVPRT